MNSMNVLILGGGGREHALAHAVAQSPRLGKLFVLPGNAGTATIATNLAGNLNDLDALVRIAKEHAIDLAIVGPEAPLCAGVVDRFERAGLLAFGPKQAAARIEGDKAFAKELMRRALVPTAEARIFDDHDAARTYVATRDCALVVKASGLAAGKGVVVCSEPSEALLVLERMMLKNEFGDAARTVIVEERLSGPELSVFALVDGCTIYMLDTARDYKRIGDGDTGPNTGGMGAVSPAPGVGDTLLRQIESDVFVPIVDALRGDGIDYRGVLYAGLMLTPAGPKVLEFNCRFGDPEAQALLPRFRGDLLEVLLACAQGRLADMDIAWDDRAAVTVVMASEGYPGRYPTGRTIEGLADICGEDDVWAFHAGTARLDDLTVTSGGRVLAVTGLGKTVANARDRAYAGVARIRFDGAVWRRDIAAGA